MQAPMTIGIITTHPDILVDYFPTAAGPDFIARDSRYTPDDELVSCN